MRIWATAIGLVLAVAAALAFLATLSRIPTVPDLEADFAGSRPFIVRQDDRQSLPPVRLLPGSALENLREYNSSVGSGFDLRSWQATYWHRWEPEVTLPILSGPFVCEGDEVCGLSVAIGSGVLDTSSAGAGLRSMLARRLNGMLPRAVAPPEYPRIHIVFPKARTVDLRITPDKARLSVTVDLVLEDNTFLRISFTARLVEIGGSLAIRRDGSPDYTWRGPTWDQFRRQAGDEAVDQTLLIIDLLAEDEVRAEGIRRGRKKAAEYVATFVDSALSEMSVALGRLSGPHHPLGFAPGAYVALRLSSTPTVSRDGIVLHLCAATSIETKQDPMVPGSPKQIPARFALPEAPTPAGNTVSVTADGDALNHLLYFLWQSGAIRRLGTSGGLISDVLKRSASGDLKQIGLGDLAFEFAGFDPGLPPVLSQSSSPRSFAFALGDVRIGDWAERRVVAHATGQLSVESEGETLKLVASLSSLTANCTRSLVWATSLTPCVSDVLAEARASLTGHPFQLDISGGDLLAELPSLSFSGGDIRLSHLQAAVDGNAMQLTLSVRAQVVEGVHALEPRSRRH